MGDEKHRWVACKACGLPVVLFLDGTFRVGHSEESEGGVSCTLYASTTAEVLWDMHQDANVVEPPDSFEQVHKVQCIDCYKDAPDGVMELVKHTAEREGRDVSDISWICPECLFARERSRKGRLN